MGRYRAAAAAPHAHTRKASGSRRIKCVKVRPSVPAVRPDWACLLKAVSHDHSPGDHPRRHPGRD